MTSIKDTPAPTATQKFDLVEGAEKDDPTLRRIDHLFADGLSHGDLSLRIVRNHNLVRKGAVFTIMAAVQCGRDLDELQKAMRGNGFWSHCKKNLHITNRTVARYMGVFRGLVHHLENSASRTVREGAGCSTVDRMIECPTAGNLSEFTTVEEALTLPEPEDLDNPSNRPVMEIIREIAGGRGLTDLYRDLGLVRKRKTKTQPRIAALRETEGDEKAADFRMWAEDVVPRLTRYEQFADDLPEEIGGAVSGLIEKIFWQLEGRAE